MPTAAYWAERDQSLNNGDNFTHYLKQAVVLFPTIEKAGEFFDASAERWPACREYAHTQSESQWTVGSISNAEGTLSTTVTQQNASRPRLGLRTRARVQKQRRYRRQYLQRQPR